MPRPEPNCGKSSGSIRAALMCVGNAVDAWKSGWSGSMKRGSVSPHADGPVEHPLLVDHEVDLLEHPPDPLVADGFEVYVRHVRASHLPARRAVDQIVDRRDVVGELRGAQPMRLTMCESLPPMPR